MNFNERAKYKYHKLTVSPATVTWECRPCKVIHFIKMKWWNDEKRVGVTLNNHFITPEEFHEEMYKCEKIATLMENPYERGDFT